MTLEQLFSLCGTLAMIGWAGLIIAPRWHYTRDLIAPTLIPLIIGALYAWLMVTNFQRAPEGAGFGSLASVASLFTVQELLLAGWIHYLAFDLFVGAWEVKDGQNHNIPHLAVIPCLVLTFMAGPAGLLAYWLVKLIVLNLRQTAVEGET